LFVFIDYLVLLQTGQAVQTQFKNGLSLHRQTVNSGMVPNSQQIIRPGAIRIGRSTSCNQPHANFLQQADFSVGGCHR
jgi:hypothetical protein